MFKRTWDFMCKPGYPHYEAALRDLIVKEAAGDKTNEIGGKGENNTGGGEQIVKTDRSDCWREGAGK